MATCLDQVAHFVGTGGPHASDQRVHFVGIRSQKLQTRRGSEGDVSMPPHKLPQVGILFPHERGENLVPHDLKYHRMLPAKFYSWDREAVAPSRLIERD